MKRTFEATRYVSPVTGADGKIDVTVTYLEMRHLVAAAQPARPLGQLAIIQARDPTVGFYRFLYNTAGEPWLWYERRVLDDSALETIICDQRVRIYVLYVDGVPAGYAELDQRVSGEVELAYFAIFPHFIGRRLGPWLLDWAVNTAWSFSPERLWVNTCSLDHPKALLIYQRRGFAPYRQETVRIRNPRQQPGWQVDSIERA